MINLEKVMKKLLVLILIHTFSKSHCQFSNIHGGITRGDTSKKQIALVFTGHEFSDGTDFIVQTLSENISKASFFLTGDFYRLYPQQVSELKSRGHYLGPHSDKHLLCCSWEDRDSLLLSKRIFIKDMKANYKEIEKLGIKKQQARFYMPAFEWYNKDVSSWANEEGIQIVNFSPGTLSHADYTTPDMKNYRSSEEILQSIYEKSDDLSGFILLMHIGTDPKRTDKLYLKLPEILSHLREKGYNFVRIDSLLR